jgi:hypothetical protein
MVPPDLAAELGQIGVEAKVDFAQLVALVVGVEHLLAASQGERVGVEADGDAMRGISPRGAMSPWKAGRRDCL